MQLDPRHQREMNMGGTEGDLTKTHLNRIAPTSVARCAPRREPSGQSSTPF